MCGRFTMLSWDETNQVARAIEASIPFNIQPDWPAVAPRSDAFPGSQAAVVMADDGGHMAIECAIPWARLSVCAMTWGFAARENLGGGQRATRGPIFNTRIETAATSSMWRDSFASRRCIVPAGAFFEPHRNAMGLADSGRRVKQVYRFTDECGFALLLAGIWKGDRFSILTREPDDVVSPVHDRMPVVLSPAAARRWLFESHSAAPEAIGLTLRAEPVYPAAPESGQLSLF